MLEFSIRKRQIGMDTMKYEIKSVVTEECRFQYGDKVWPIALFWLFGPVGFRCKERIREFASQIICHKLKAFEWEFDRLTQLQLRGNWAWITRWTVDNIFFGKFGLWRFWCKEQNQWFFNRMLLYKLEAFDWNLDWTNKRVFSEEFVFEFWEKWK